MDPPGTEDVVAIKTPLEQDAKSVIQSDLTSRRGSQPPPKKLSNASSAPQPSKISPQEGEGQGKKLSIESAPSKISVVSQSQKSNAPQEGQGKKLSIESAPSKISVVSQSQKSNAPQEGQGKKLSTGSAPSKISVQSHSQKSDAPQGGQGKKLSIESDSSKVSGQSEQSHSQKSNVSQEEQGKEPSIQSDPSKMSVQSISQKSNAPQKLVQSGQNKKPVQKGTADHNSKKPTQESRKGSQESKVSKGQPIDQAQFEESLLDLGEEGQDIAELMSRRGTNPTEDNDDHKLTALQKILKRRRISEELRKNPPPDMYERQFDLEITDANEFRKVQEQRRLSKMNRLYPPINVLVVPDFNERLPPIGATRQRELECIPDHIVAKTNLANKAEYFQVEEVRNPFFIPSDMHAYIVKNEEERKQKRSEELKVPLLKKMHGIAKVQAQVAELTRPYMNRGISADVDPTNLIKWEAMNALNTTRLQKVARKAHANYMTHRRNVFYAEYAIYAREKALQMIREEEEAEEIGLKNYEYLSSYTQDSLDVFLKDNDESSAKASKAAEEKMKENIALTNDVRELRLETSSLKNDISSLNENLKECKFYMRFLDGVARELMRRDEEDAYRIERRQHQIKEDITRYMKQGMSKEEAEQAIKDKENEYAGVTDKLKKNKDMSTESAEFVKNLYDEAQAQATNSPVGSRIQSLFRRVSVRMRDDDDFNEEALFEELDLVGGDEKTDREELAGLIFTKPAQLLDIFVEVEEQNLSLIQHAQINEELLEAVERRIKDSRKETETRSRELRDMINLIESETAATQERIESLNLLIDMFTGGYYDVKSQEKMMKLLRKHVNKVYKAAVGSTDAHLSSVLMLTSVEKNFEDIVRDLDNMPGNVVSKISRDLEKERRELERRELEDERHKQRDARISRNMARNRAPVKVKRGRTLPFRSRPPKLAIHLTQHDLDKKAEEDEFNYFFGE